jgi:hypothetical protein
MGGVGAYRGKAVQETLEILALAPGERIPQELGSHERGHLHEPSGEAGFEEGAVFTGEVGDPGGVISYEYRQAFSPRRRAGGFCL